jgi:hypothetical protein
MIKLHVSNNYEPVNFGRLPVSGPARAQYIALLSALFRAHLPVLVMQMMRDQQIVMLAQFNQYQRFSNLFTRALLMNAMKNGARYQAPRIEPEIEYRAPAPLFAPAPSAPERVLEAPQAKIKENPPMPSAPEMVEANVAPPTYKDSSASSDPNIVPSYDTASKSTATVDLPPSYDLLAKSETELAPPAYSE